MLHKHSKDTMARRAPQREQIRTARAQEAQAFREQRQRQSAVWSKSKGRCWYCGIQCRLRTRQVTHQLSLSHLLPLSRGGSDDLSNLVPSCRPCSTRKGRQTLEELRARETQRRQPRWTPAQLAELAQLGMPVLGPKPGPLPVVFWCEEEGNLWPS